jgi:hypothetical protein
LFKKTLSHARSALVGDLPAVVARVKNTWYGNVY